MDLSVAIKQVPVSVAIMQLEVSGAHMQVKDVIDNFRCNYTDGVSVAIMQVVFSAVHYAHDCFNSNYAGKSFFYSYVGDSFK